MRRTQAAIALCCASLIVATAEAQLSSPEPLSPNDAAATFEVHPDFRWDLVLAEPEIEQPVFVTFDPRGRMWVVEYRQYPEPAGLEVLSHDVFWRAIYDRVPEPPPHGVPGRDRISIHEDADGDGTYESHKVFVDGLNIATSVAFSDGGVWVLNPPYLLFYPDADGDDVPDGDPEVALSGFGLEDTHSVANSLQWGPDGWLYGAQGSTVTGSIRVAGSDAPPVQSLGQLIWRYHPQQRRYEIFSEGGGNAFGVEIDSAGRTFSGHNGGDTRGFHYMQGAYLQKGFGKHGSLSNPHAFGYFPAMTHPSVPRFTHTFVIYEGDALPAAWDGMLYGVAPLLNYVVASRVIEDGSTFRTEDVEQVVKSSDPWFRPVDVKVGPDGALYVCDWYDDDVGHARNYESGVDKEDGRIYRLAAKDAPPSKSVDMLGLSSSDLVGELASRSKWRRRTALQVLAERKDQSVVPMLRTMLVEQPGQAAAEALLALHLLGRFDAETFLAGIRHDNPVVRIWAVRLFGDLLKPPPWMDRAAPELTALGETEPNVEVRAQIACTAKRLPAASGLPIAAALAARDIDVNDPRMPLLIWWAVEGRVDSHRDEVMDLFTSPSVWEEPIVREHLAPRLARRLAVRRLGTDFASLMLLFEAAPNRESRQALYSGVEAAFADDAAADLPAELAAMVAEFAGQSLPFRVQLGEADAVAEALRRVQDESAPADERARLVKLLGQTSASGADAVLLSLLQTSNDEAIIAATLSALAAFPDEEIGSAVLERWSQFTAASRQAAAELLASRGAWSRLLIDAASQSSVDPREISTGLARRMLIVASDETSARIRSLWPDVAAADATRFEAEIGRCRDALAAGEGDPYAGQKLFGETCAKCHRLFDSGGEIGPDLTPFDRRNAAAMLLAVIHPSAEIREGFEQVTLVTTDGRVISGYVVDRDERRLVLKTPTGDRVAAPRDAVEEVLGSPNSLMPEGLLRDWSDQQVRDLFAYLRSGQPLNN